MLDSSIKSDKSSLSFLQGEGRKLAARALSNMFATEVAQSAFAQIVDGLPLLSVLEDTWAGLDLQPGHPVFSHQSLCPGALQKTKELLQALETENLKFDTSLLRALQAHEIGSSSFNTRLIEFTAVSVHEVAKYLYGVDIRGHRDDGIETWVPPKNKDWEWWWKDHADRPPPTLFQHKWYFDYQNYPDGVADTVGYWAESRILGGVILFDRKEPASNAVFIHPDRDEVTYRICELTEEQKTGLVRFLLTPPSEHDNLSLHCPLPITPGAENTHRVDPEEPISWTGVYRDSWGREIHPETMDDGRARNVWSLDRVDYLTFEEWQEARGRYFSRFDRYPEGLLDNITS